jgi:hypothetical protein
MSITRVLKLLHVRYFDFEEQSTLIPEELELEVVNNGHTTVFVKHGSRLYLLLQPVEMKVLPFHDYQLIGMLHQDSCTRQIFVYFAI